MNLSILLYEIGGPQYAIDNEKIIQFRPSVILLGEPHASSLY
jgi:hypothetical protein